MSLLHFAFFVANKLVTLGTIDKYL